MYYLSFFDWLISLSIMSSGFYLCCHILQNLFLFKGSKVFHWSEPPMRSIFLTQGLNLGLLHHRQILYLLSHQRSHTLCIYTTFSKPFTLQ